MKILLAYCAEKEHKNDYYITLLPVGLVSIASYLTHFNLDVTLANFSKKNTEQILKAIKDVKPTIIGFSLYTHNRTITLSLIRKIKKINPKIIIVIGGPHATFLSAEIISLFHEVDHVVLGEGEEAMHRIVEAVSKNKKLHKIVKSDTVDIKHLHYPALFKGKLYDVNVNEQYKYILTSRGCIFNCTFCDSPSFWGRKVRYRDVTNVIEELETLYRKFGIIYFSMRDDNFTLKKDRVLELSDRITKKKLYMMWNCQARVDAVDEHMLIAMKNAGLEHIQYGVESGSLKILSCYNKKITIEDIVKASSLTRRVGVYLSVYLMIGMTDETYDDIKKTKMLLKKILPGDCVVSPVALYPGTMLYEQEKQKGNISDSTWFQRKESGIFLRNDPIIKEWMNELLITNYNLRSKSWYKASDFALHRQVAGELWVTDILEGDYYLDNEMYMEASRVYSKVINAMPDNPWGYMRYGKLYFTMGEYETAVNSFSEVTRIVPNYYGGWLKYAQSMVALGMKEKAHKAIQKAYQLNPYDEKIQHLVQIMSKKNKKIFY